MKKPTVKRAPKKRKIPQKRGFRFSRRVKPANLKKLPSVMTLLIGTLKHIWRYKRIYFGVIAVYVVLNIIFVKGFASHVDVASLKSDLNQSGNLNGIGLNSALVGILVGSGSSSVTDTGSLYQSMILIISALAFIWLFRQTHDSPDDPVKVRQPFYKGMTPLIPFLLVLFVVGLQLIPMLAGLSLFGTIQANGLAATVLEQVLWGLLAVVLSLLTFYMISSSLFALIIVTLPDMTPMKALRTARKVVDFRRWVIMRKIFTSIIVLLIVFMMTLYLFISIIPGLAEWVMVLLTALILPLTIGSGYRLYRELI